MAEDKPQDPGTENPDDRLRRLKEELQKSDDALGDKTRERDALKADVEALAKALDELTKTGPGFGQGAAKLEPELKEVATYFGTKWRMVVAALGSSRPAVEAAIRRVNEDVDDKKREAAKLAEEESKARAENEEAQNELKEKQAEFEKQKNRLKTLGDNIQKLKDYRARIEKFDDQNKTASMYALLREMERLLGETKIPTQAEYEADLRTAWEAVAAARGEARAAKLKLDEASEQSKKAQDAAADAEKKRQENILLAVEPYDKPKQEAAGSQETQAGPGDTSPTPLPPGNLGTPGATYSPGEQGATGAVGGPRPGPHDEPSTTG